MSHFHTLAVAKLKDAGGILQIADLTRHEVKRIQDSLCDAHPRFKTKRGKAWTRIWMDRIEITAYGWQRINEEAQKEAALCAGMTLDGWQVTVGARVSGSFGGLGTVLEVGRWCRVQWDNGCAESSFVGNLKEVTP